MKKKLMASLLILCLAFSVGLVHAKTAGEVCEPTTFLNVTPETFGCMKTKLQDYGIYVPPGNFGEVSGKGAAGVFLWDGKSILTAKIEEKPFFVSCETTAGEARKFVEGCQGS